MLSFVRSAVFLAMLLAAVADGCFRKTFLGMRIGAEGAVWVSRWCRRMVRTLGLECSVEGAVPSAGQQGLAVVSNHLSYLDILVMSATQPFIMVSKTEVRSWPLLGWITAQAGTIYVQRADVRGGQTQTHAEVNALMAEAFRSGLPVLFYPEGTTTGGETILPFRRGLFYSIVSSGVPVRAAALTYTIGSGNGSATIADDVCFVGDAAFGPHLFKALGLKKLRVRVSFGGQPVPGDDRFDLAQNSRDAVIELYEELTGLTSIPRQVAFPSRQREYIFDSSPSEQEAGRAETSLAR